MSIKVGIISAHSVNCYLLDEITSQGIDLSYLEYCKELERQGLENEELEEQLERYEADCSTYLFGDWLLVNGRYEIDKRGPHGYSVTYNTDNNIICVEYSKIVVLALQTSPCYVMADGSGPCGDLDNLSTRGYQTYGLPLELLEHDLF